MRITRCTSQSSECCVCCSADCLSVLQECPAWDGCCSIVPLQRRADRNSRYFAVHICCEVLDISCYIGRISPNWISQSIVCSRPRHLSPKLREGGWLRRARFTTSLATYENVI